MSRLNDTSGFTLMEIMVAIAILGTSLLILLDTHYASTQLLVAAQDELVLQTLIESVLGEAELNVQAGEESGSGNFGDRYPDYTYSWTATPMGTEDMETPLTEVTATVSGPDSERVMTMYVFVMAGTGVSENQSSQLFNDSRKR